MCDERLWSKLSDQLATEGRHHFLSESLPVALWSNLISEQTLDCRLTRQLHGSLRNSDKFSTVAGASNVIDPQCFTVGRTFDPTLHTRSRIIDRCRLPVDIAVESRIHEQFCDIIDIACRHGGRDKPHGFV